MKAVVVIEPGVAVVQDVQRPVRATGEVLLQVRLVGMCGSDMTTYLGRNPMVSYPRVLGHEIAATVAEPGESGLPVGTNVTFSPYTACGTCPSCLRGRSNACQFNQTLGVQRDGAMTEFVSVPAANLCPSSLPLEALALVEPLTVGAHAIARGRVEATDIVAVFGCGGVGLGAIAAAAFRKARVIAIDRDDAKLEIARKAGATHLLNVDTEDLHETLMRWTEGRGPDVFVEAVGLPQTFVAAVQEVAFTGRVVYIGYAKEAVAYETRLFVQKELDILGARNAQPADFRFVLDMLEQGNFPVQEAISTTVSIEDAPAILAEWSRNPAKFTKIQIKVS
ncbi:MAG: zinc-binding alcohol dehydrogenase family protein [Janthinobacterium lividum]